MTVTESKPISKKLAALFLALGAVTLEYRDRDQAEFQRYQEVAKKIESLLCGDTDPRLPCQVLKGLRGLDVQDKFFNAWAYEIGQAGSSALAMVEAMTGGKA